MKEQTNMSKRSKSVRIFLLVAIPVILFLVAIQYAVLSVVSVRNHLKSVYQLDDVKLLSAGSGADTVWFGHYKEKTWLETRFQISRTDSISLSINLKDSLLQLELKGVVLKTSKITAFEADQFFYQLNAGAYHHFFGGQATGTNALSTIEKEPLIVKKAPKDSIEFANQKHVVDSLKDEAVHWMLKLDNGIVLKIEGTDEYTNSEWWQGQQFWWKQDFLQLKKDLRKTLFFEVPEYQPQIELVISEADAKAIYRALPVQPLICIRM
ncbi:hypothetical protein [Mangrovibacterium sp.]|uniref:hypothetical protein n=1 Tax=Mangrovibacterium sp. TaxID=1961364 RepID=UPI00356569E8